MSVIDDIGTHDRLTGDLVSAVAGTKLSYNADLATLACKLADLMEHDARTMTAREFRDAYGALERDIRRAVRKWAKER